MFAQLLDSWSEGSLRVWISAVPRQAALMLAVALLVRCFPRMAASWRHWIWLWAGLAIGIIPLATAALPQWPLIPAEWVYGSAVSQATKMEAQTLLGEPMAPISMGEPLSFGWVELCFLAWLAGVLLLLARLGMGMLGLRSIQKKCPPVYRGRLCARLEYCRRLAGISCLVDLYLSRRSTLPMTWGVLRPAINLPQEAETWSDERLDAVFLHELGHIQRADCWTNMVLKVVCALNWFNPFVWMAARRTYLAQEVACDDFACSRLRASDYARHLLELTVVIKDFHRRTIEPAVGLSSCEHLRIRLAAALDPRRRRDSLSGRVANLMSSAVFFLMSVMAMISLRFFDESHAAFARPTPQLVADGGLLDEDGFLAVPALMLDAFGKGPEEAGQSVFFNWEIDFEFLRETEEAATFPLWAEPEIQSQSSGEPDSGTPDGPSEIPETMAVEPGREENPVPAESDESTDPLTPSDEEDPVSFPPVVPAKVVGAKAVPASPQIVPKPIGPRKLEINWKKFQRRAGSARRGRSVVLSPAESVLHRYARLSPVDRARAGAFRPYLRRAGFDLSDAEIWALIEGLRRKRSK